MTVEEQRNILLNAIRTHESQYRDGLGSPQVNERLWQTADMIMNELYPSTDSTS